MGKRERQGVLTFCVEKRQNPVISVENQFRWNGPFHWKIFGRKKEYLQGYLFFLGLTRESTQGPFPSCLHHAVNSSRSRLSINGLLAVSKAAINPRACK